MEQPTQAEIEASRAALTEKACACCGFALGTTPAVERIMFGRGDSKPSLETLHQTCYEFVKKHVDGAGRLAAKREREREVG